MSTRICPVCGADYLDWVESCSTCGVLLVAPAQAPDPLRLPVDQQVVYELGVWPLGMQAAAAQAMAESGIPHGWSGTDLVIQLDHEATVDALLEEVEDAQPGLVGADWLDGQPEPGGDLGAAVGAARATGDDEDEFEYEVEDEEDDERQVSSPEAGEEDGWRVAGDAAAAPTTEWPDGLRGGGDDELEYELDEWPEHDRIDLTRRLEEGGIPHRWEDDTVLVVAATDEELVETLLDEVEFPDALEPQPEDEADEASFELMSELFVAADRLKGDPRDPDGIRGLASVVETADPARPPYGVEPDLWQHVLVVANDLADRLAGAGDEDGDGFIDGEVDDEGEPVPTEGDLVTRAATLRNLLRPFV